MVEMETVASTIVMLAVAFGVGLIGGIGAAVIEVRKRCAEGGKSDGCSPFWGAIGCVVLGGIAAVAILYFFVPTEKIVVDPADPTETTTFYDLTKLVALSLLVGSAGTAVLQSLQGRLSAQIETEKANQGKDATKATADEALAGVVSQAEKAATTGVEAAASQVQAELQKQQALSPGDAQELVGKLAEEASTKVAETLAPQVDAARQMVAAAAEPATEG